MADTKPPTPAATVAVEMVGVAVEPTASNGTAKLVGKPTPAPATPQKRQWDITIADKAMHRLFAQARSYSSELAIACVFSILNKVLDLMPPVMVGLIIDVVNNEGPAWVTDIGSTNTGVAIVLAMIVLLVFLFESLFQWVYTRTFMRLAQNLQHDLRVKVYAHLQRQEHAFFENHRVGDVMTMLNDDINSLERFLNTGFNALLQLVVLFCFSVATLIGSNWRLALVGLWPLPLVAWVGLWYHRRISPRYAVVRRCIADVASRLENNIGGMAVIKSFNAEQFEVDRVSQSSLAYKAANFHAINMSTVYVPAIRQVVALGFGGVVLLGAYWILSDGADSPVTVGQLVLFSMLIQRVLWPLTRLGPVFDDYERAASAAGRTFGLLDRVPKIRDPDRDHVQHLPPQVPGQPSGAIEFKDVHFAYSGARQPVLKGASLTTPAGKFVGLCGTTGAGKSTIIKLLLRLYDSSHGAVTLDGVDVRNLPLRELRQRVALVSQDVFIFAGSVRENIAYGLHCVEDADPRAGQPGTVTHSQVEEAAKVAQLHDFVTKMPHGYDTVVGERGVKLSGGQRQRLSIARAVLKNAPVIALDEATSAVDTETERLIQRSLDTFTRGRTALVVAHRLSTIRHADTILVLSDGVVAEQGSFDELIAARGTFAELWALQSGEDVPPPTADAGHGAGAGAASEAAQ